MEYYGDVLRQRGLTLAREGDYLGACLSFFEAALANPLDKGSAIDAARTLTRLGRPKDALHVLAAHKRSLSDDEAHALAVAIKEYRGDGAEPGAGQNREATADEPGPNTALVPLRKPLLQLPPIPKKRGMLGRMWDDKTSRLFWELIIWREQQWDGDWSVLASCVDAGPTDVLADGILQYVEGLALFQRGEDEEAARVFKECLEFDPPFVNPAAYVLYLHTGEQIDVPFMEDWLRGQTSRSEGVTLVQMMLRGLQGRLTPSQQQNLQLLEDYLRGSGAARQRPPALPVAGGRPASDGTHATAKPGDPAEPPPTGGARADSPWSSPVESDADSESADDTTPESSADAQSLAPPPQSPSDPGV